MKIAIVNDLPLAVEALRRVLALKPEHRVVWVAENGAKAVQRCAELRPDLILMDLLMPEMDGVEATRRIMSETPCAILLVTANMGANTARVFKAMGHGALDVVDTPALGAGDPRVGAAPVLAKIEIIARLIGDSSRADTGVPRFAAASGAGHPQRLVAIGASAGGPAALATLLRGLPADFPAAVVIVQHVDEQFAAGMAEWLGQHSTLPVGVAREGDRPTRGAVLLAATNDHLRLVAGGRLAYTRAPQDYVYRPSVDVFFHSACALWQGDIVGVLLTGMGRDGAHGLKALRDKGHYTIAQNQASCAVYGMPKAAIALDAAVDVLPIEAIATRLRNALSTQPEPGGPDDRS
ncbi:chemotaxis response regulator protein-glutamate methylesterase [Variovorax sp. RT4R15]|uniref:chemotaxis response regulator protein-glutamate methylesterase n=1 Tax=Variovorax sp. RT4R15 TaxID=3443737 RepID=UPI003F45E435